MLNRAYSVFAIGMIVLIDRLQGQLIHRNAELTSQAATLEALYEIGTGLSALLDVGTIKDTAVRRARQLFASDTAGLAMLHEASGEVRWHLLAGEAGEALKSIRLQIGQGLVGKAIQSGEPMMVENAQLQLESEELIALNPVLAEARLRAVLVVPVRIAGRPIGALMVGYHEPRSFNLNDVKLLSGLANQVAVAINNAHLHEQLGALSVLKERQRLAREMHDGLAQLLGNVTARATATGELLDQGKVVDARAQLARLREVAQKAYVDVRQSILGLRTPSSQKHGLLGALNEYIERLNEQGGIPIRMECSEVARIQDLPPAVEVQTIRIIQEALNNVRKHSQAESASIKVCGGSDWLTITIQDDGQGFDVPRGYKKGDHFGLQMMRERAESVGGRLTVNTAPGKGTSLTVELPTASPE